MLSWRNSLYGGFVYAIGDAVAAAIAGEFELRRLSGMLLVGGTVYAVEIPAYFGWLNRRFRPDRKGYAVMRALGAQAFFNPLWIARHIALIELFSGRAAEIGWNLLALGLNAFLHALPVALLCNYAIQNLISLSWRFTASALFSSGMAVYYALSEVLFE